MAKGYKLTFTSVYLFVSPAALHAENPQKKYCSLFAFQRTPVHSQSQQHGRSSQTRLFHPSASVFVMVPAPQMLSASEPPQLEIVTGPPHDAAPGPALCCPAGQDVQLTLPAAPYLPAAQPTQSEAASAYTVAAVAGV